MTLSGSGGLSQHFLGSGQNLVTAKTEFEPGRVTAQRIILLLPSLSKNIYFVICIELIQSYLRLWDLILSPKTLLVDISLYQHTDVLLVYSYMLCMCKPFLAIIVLVVILILPGRGSLSGLALRVKLPMAVDPCVNTGPSARFTTSCAVW